MVKREIVVFLALAGGLAACHGRDYWVDRLQGVPLYQRADKLRSSGPCASMVPMEFGRSFPVPVRGGKFKVLYYPLERIPSKVQVLTPIFEGLFSMASTEGDACVRITTGTVESLGLAVPPGVSMTTYYHHEARLYESLGRVSDRYSRGGVVDEGDRRVMADFVESFQAIAEPGLRSSYYNLNPDFWNWLGVRS